MKLSGSIHHYAFQIAVLIALVSVLLSCANTYRAIDDLPEIQRQITSLNQQLERKNDLRAVIGSALWRSSLASRGENMQGNADLMSVISRGKLLIDEISSHQSAAKSEPIAAVCDDFLGRLNKLATAPVLREPVGNEDLQRQGAALQMQLRQQILEGRETLGQMRQLAADRRRLAVIRLLGGHALMFATIGLLYFARLTEKRRRELADLKLLAADERYALVVRGSADGIILADAQGRILMANPAAEAMFGYDGGELAGRSVRSLFETTLLDEWVSNRAGSDNKPESIRNVRAQATGGKTFSAELTITRQAIHNQIFLAISVRDVSERKSSRLRLRHHEALLREIPEPLHILDSGGQIIYWNNGAQRLYGYQASEAIGKSAADLLGILPPSGDDNNVHSLDYAEADRWTGQLRATTKEGRSLRIERRRTRITEGAEMIGEVIFDLDLGEHTRLQRVERRRQRLEALGMLASGIAHDLNNLLTPILMSSRMLQRGGDKFDRDAMLETVVAGASRGADLITQLLTFARGGEGQHSPVDLNRLLDEISGILKQTLSSNIKFETNVIPSLPPISGDATEISQIIMNLAINARDALTDGGTLEISATSLTLNSERTYSLTTLQPGNYVAISVSDDGVGIPKSIRDRIFDPFFSTKQRGQGTGLGLSTSLGIVRSHNGTIDIRSTVGQGTRVTVLFPACSESCNNTEVK